MKSLLLFLLFPIFGFSQEQGKWKDSYAHFEGSYEDNFSCDKTLTRKGKKRIKNFSNAHCRGFLNVTLNVTGSYSILLELPKVQGDSLNWEVREFEGSFTVDSLGTLLLKGPHPFSQDKLIIKEWQSKRNGQRYISGRGFKYQFKEEYLWISRKKLNTYCDGCQFNPEE
jgi:hypothetical protein